MNGSRKRHARARAAAFGVASALLVLAACEAKLPTSAEIASMDVASAQRNASEAGFMRTPGNSRTDYFVNGVAVSPEQATVLDAQNIGSIEIVRSARSDGRDTIFVTTIDRMPAASRKMSVSGPERSKRPDRDSLLIRSGEEPLFLIDGRQATPAEFKALDQSRVVSVTVFKGEAARAYSSYPAAAHGVIAVTTKRSEK